WIHFVANIGAAGGELSLLSASDDLRQLREAERVRGGQAPDKVAPKTLVPSGETRDIHRPGGRCITLVGSNPLFHLPHDRWPHAVDTDVVTRIAAAALVVDLAEASGVAPRAAAWIGTGAVRRRCDRLASRPSCRGVDWNANGTAAANTAGRSPSRA